MLEAKITIVAPELTAAINHLAEAISGTHSQPTVDTPAAPSVGVPTQTAANAPVAQPPQYTVDQIMAAGATLMDAGRVNDLMNLLHSFGVQAVMDLKPEQRGAFAAALRDLGAKI